MRCVWKGKMTCAVANIGVFPFISLAFFKCGKFHFMFRRVYSCKRFIVAKKVSSFRETEAVQNSFSKVSMTYRYPNGKFNTMAN